MPHRDSGVTELLHRASDDLTPDVDRLVSGGIARGRTRQRRARIGTTVASLAVIGVVGGLAVVVPRLGSPDSARDPGIATDGASATQTPTQAPTETTPDATVPRDLAQIHAGQVPAIVNGLLGTTLATDARSTDTVADEPDQKFVTFPYDGMHTTVGMNNVLEPSLDECQEEARRLEGSCVRMPDGAVQQRWGPVLADRVTCQGVSVYRHGYTVWATSCNAAEAKESEPLAARPPLDMDDLIAIAASEVWFE